MLCVSQIAFAQSGGTFIVKQNVIGGGTSEQNAGGQFKVNGIVGQPSPNTAAANQFATMGGYLTARIRGRNVNADFDGDDKTDVAVFRPSNNTWYFLNSLGGASSAAAFGFASDKLAPADYDGKTEIGVFRESDGTWCYLRSSDGVFSAAQFGANGDKPIPGDFDSDGKADQSVFRPSDGTWYFQRTTGGFTVAAFGASGDSFRARSCRDKKFRVVAVGRNQLAGNAA